MRIGVVREVMDGETRVALGPGGVRELVGRGHLVAVERGAGELSGFSDEDYRGAGAEIVEDADRLWGEAEMVVKVKQPLPEEFGRLREGLILFTYLHLAAHEDVTRALLERGVTGLDYATIETEDGGLPLLRPMSVIAGRLAPQVGAHWLESAQGGSGVLLGPAPGVEAGRTVVLGGGSVGAAAAEVALGLGSRVLCFEILAGRREELVRRYPELEVARPGVAAVGAAVAEADLVVGAILRRGERTEHLVTEGMVRRMRRGSVIVDVAVDQGGAIETIDRATTHLAPVYERHGVIHYAVANMPALVPHSATRSLTAATLPWIMEVAEKGVERAVRENGALGLGLNTYGGRCTCEPVARAFGLEF